MKKLMLLFASVFVLAAVSARAQTTASASPKTPFDGVVKFKQDAIDFGTTKYKKPVTVTFEFTNIGQKPLIIQSAQPSCGCTTPDWTRQPVMPGKEGKVTATFNAETLGLVNKTVFVNFNGIAATKELHLRGRVVQ